MKYDKAKWIAAYNKAMQDLKSAKPTEGRICAIASVRVIRDGLIDDIVGDGKKASKDDLAFVDTIKESCLELINQLRLGAEDGFASNASAAAKAAGHKAEASAAIDNLTE